MPLLESFITLLAPHTCVLCETEGEPLCVVCRQLELPPVPSRCYSCQQVTQDYAVCQTCRRNTALRHVWVKTIYDDTTSKVLMSFKFERARAAYRPIAMAMAETLPLLPPDTLLIAMPTATSHIRQRGYDHARLITRHLGSLGGYVWVSPVVRTGQAHQFGASRQERLEQLSSAFHVVDPETVRNKRVLIVDDVLTTGASLETLAKALKDAGAKQVDAVVFAQKV